MILRSVKKDSASDFLRQVDGMQPIRNSIGCVASQEITDPCPLLSGSRSHFLHEGADVIHGLQRMPRLRANS